MFFVCCTLSCVIHLRYSDINKLMCVCFACLSSPCALEAKPKTKVRSLTHALTHSLAHTLSLTACDAKPSCISRVLAWVCPTVLYFTSIVSRCHFYSAHSLRHSLPSHFTPALTNSNYLLIYQQKRLSLDDGLSMMLSPPKVHREPTHALR